MGGSLPLTFLPSVRLHVNKGFAGKVDIGLSGLWFLGMWMLGADVKVVVWQQEEGLTWAVRLNYSYSYIPFPLPAMGMSGLSMSTTVNGVPATATVNLSFYTHTFTPQVLVSKRLGAFDPYLGVGAQITVGGLHVGVSGTADVPVLGPQPFSDSQDLNGFGWGAMFFGGVSMRIPYVALRLTPEIAYSTAGAVSAGVKLGFTF
jgi:hypothetical protein